MTVTLMLAHLLSQVDLILMSALSQHVALIPVIAKADTMTQEETKRYRQVIFPHEAPPCMMRKDTDAEMHGLCSDGSPML